VTTSLGAAARRINWGKVAIVLAALLLFILAIQLLKSGAKALVPYIQGWAVSNAANALGFGWLFAYGVLSGSPVAATALTFFDAGAIDQLGAFAMIAGSRFGASFIVLALGFVYALRGHNKRDSLAMGLLSLLVTFAIYTPALLVGYSLLESRVLDWLTPREAWPLLSLLDVLFDPVIGLAERTLPQLAVFALGFGVLWFSLNLIDRGLPEFHLQEHPGQRWLERPWFTFLLGLGITSLTMSVSVSLSILVPLAVRGYVRRGNVIPYIMGANITTFIDTLVAALLLNNPPAFVVVLAEMLSVTIVSLIILLVGYRPYESALLHIADAIGHSRRTLAIFLLVILVIPLALLLVR